MKKTAFLVVAACFVVFAFGCGRIEAERLHAGRAADFTIKDIDGNIVRLSDYKGKVILINFFATWCPPCKMEMPDFNEIQKEYKNSVKVIAINVGREPLQRVRAFVRRRGLEFTVALDNGTVSRLYGPIRVIPVSVIIDRDFNIAARYTGLRSKEVFVRDIKSLL